VSPEAICKAHGVALVRLADATGDGGTPHQGGFDVNTESTVRLRTGHQMPVMGLGTWELTHDTSTMVEHALEIGYRMIDTSGDYGTQRGVGNAMRNSGLPRERMYLVTKVEEHENAYAATRSRLGELGLDRADLMLIHRPPTDGAGEELWDGLLRARDEGLTRDIGVSNYSVSQIERLIEASGETPAVNQIEWSPFGHDARMRDFCRQHQVVIQAYSPLTRAERLDDERLNDVAREVGRTPAQVLLRWNLQRGSVPLPKANLREHQAENLGVFDFELSADQLDRLDALNEDWSALGGRISYVEAG
jgi:2,5-diketo-D-gluconate reductase A